MLAGRRGAGRPLPDLVNTAVLQTLLRTVNTGMGAALVLAALAVFGGDPLTDFALAALIGVVVGTYSSVFVAAPLALELSPRPAIGRRVRRPAAAATPQPARR
jgi:SecD/SecF fusion protein